MITSKPAAIVSGFDLSSRPLAIETWGRWLLAIFTSLVLTGAVSVAHAQVTFFSEGPGADQDLPFSEAVRVNGLLFVSGQVGTDNSGALVAGGIESESHQVMKNIRDIIHRRGLTMNNVVKCTVFLADVSQWGEFNKIYTTYFSKPYPARSALGANGLALGAALEVECIAAYPTLSEPRSVHDERS